jgi:Antibiotic biosynthesis monooxygenase
MTAGASAKRTQQRTYRPVHRLRFGFRRLSCPQTEGSMPEIRPDSDFVTQITIAEAEEGKQAELLALMVERARFMARQPGFISISLHRSLDGKHIANLCSGPAGTSWWRRIIRPNSGTSGRRSVRSPKRSS